MLAAFSDKFSWSSRKDVNPYFQVYILAAPTEGKHLCDSSYNKSGHRFCLTWFGLPVHLWNKLSGQRLDGPRSAWWIESPPPKPYGEKVSNSQRKTGLLLLQYIMHAGKAKTIDPKESAPWNPCRNLTCQTRNPHSSICPLLSLEVVRMGKHTALQLSDGRSSAFHVSCGFKPAGKAGRSYGNQARYGNLWNKLGSPTFLACGSR